MKFDKLVIKLEINKNVQNELLHNITKCCLEADRRAESKTLECLSKI